MNPSSVRFTSPGSRLLVAALSCLAIGSACSSDEAAPAAPITFGIEVTQIDGHAVDLDVALRCDHGGVGADTAAFSTLAVTVTLTPTEASRKFVLSPANACGSSTRCGFVRVQALDASGAVLAQTDTVTTEGVLKLGVEQLSDLSQIRVSLVRGLDREPLQNPDKTAVESIVTPSFVVPSACVALPPAGLGGAGGETSIAGAGGQTLGGAGGDTSSPALGGAGGDDAGLGGIGGA